MGSEDIFLEKRTEGTERSDKAAPNKGVEKFWGDMPTWGMYDGPRQHRRRHRARDRRQLRPGTQRA